VFPLRRELENRAMALDMGLTVELSAARAAV